MTTYAYDPRGQLAEVVNPFGEATTWTWDALGREARQRLGNGVSVSQTYDPAGRAASRVYYDPEGVELAMYTASYDPVGNRVGVEELDGGFAYAYDPSRQLVGEVRAGTGAYACTFTYDGPGNRLTQMQADGTLTSYTYNPASELLTAQVGEAVTTFSYDPVGNTVSEQTEASETNFTWDAENRLVEVDDGETVETSAYDATGLRRQKTAGGSTTHFVWDRVNLLAELDDTLARLAQYTDYPGVWGGLSSQRRNSTASYYAFDLSANTRALFNGGGITDRYLYEAFGLEQIVTGSTVNPLRFGGQVGYWRDLAERLYVRARWYRQGLGSWMSRDPESGNRSPALAYTYVVGRVPMFVDPSGLYGPGAYPPWLPGPPPSQAPERQRGGWPGDYGNWCGGLNAGPGEPVDRLDACCLGHDICLERADCGTLGVLAPWRCDCQLCNVALCNCLKNVDCDSSPSPGKCMLYSVVYMAALSCWNPTWGRYYHCRCRT